MNKFNNRRGRIVEYLRYAMRVMGRILNVFVVMPAAIMFLMAMLAYQFSFKDMVRDAYGYIDQVAHDSVSVAPGYLAIQSCASAEWECKKGALKTVSVDDLSSSAASSVLMSDWALVMAGLLANIFVRGPRQFFMMERAVSSNDVKR